MSAIYPPKGSQSTNKLKVGRRPDRDRRTLPSIVCDVCPARDEAALRCQQMRGAFCQIRRVRREA
jgi:hypothetical protein